MKRVDEERPIELVGYLKATGLDTVESFLRYETLFEVADEEDPRNLYLYDEYRAVRVKVTIEYVD